MNQRKMRKYEKLLALAKKRLDQIQLELGRQVTAIEQVARQRSEAEQQLTTLRLPSSKSVNLIDSRATASQWMTAVQERVDALAGQKTELETGLASIVDRYHVQNSKLKSWEKLVEKEAIQLRHDQGKRELDQADERYLGHKRQGNIQ